MKEDPMDKILKFNKQTYWDRRHKGLRGQIGLDAKSQRRDRNVMRRRMLADQKGKAHESTKD